MSDARLDALRHGGSQVVRVSFVDLHGRMRSKDLPLERVAAAADGVGFCAMALAESPRGVPVEGALAADCTYGDLRAVPDLATARRVPWEPGVGWLLASTDEPACPRAALQRAVTALDDCGVGVRVGPEIEFHLFERDRDGQLLPYGGERAIAYVAGPRHDPRGTFAELQHAADALGLRLASSTRELSPGQFELALAPGPPLDAVDRLAFAREAIREIASRHGLEASFLAKASDAAEPSGLHLHLSLCDLDGTPIGDARVAAATDAAVAGLLAHADALTALGCPTLNSYRRLAAGGLVPSAADWGHDDRFACVRTLEDRVELRVGDALANAHLLLAGALAAIRDGLLRDLPLPPARDTQAQPPHDAPPLPASLPQALAALLDDDVVADALGNPLVGAFVQVKRDEIARAARHVPAWEREEYGGI